MLFGYIFLIAQLPLGEDFIDKGAQLFRGGAIVLTEGLDCYLLREKF